MNDDSIEMHEPTYPKRRRERPESIPEKVPQPITIPVAPPLPSTPAPERVPEKTPEKISSWLIEAEQGFDQLKAPTEEEIEDGPIMNQQSNKVSSWIVEAEGMAGSNDQLYLDPMFTGAGDGQTGPAIQKTPLTDQGTSTETLTASLKESIYDSNAFNYVADNIPKKKQQDPQQDQNKDTTATDDDGEKTPKGTVKPRMTGLPPGVTPTVPMLGSKISTWIITADGDENIPGSTQPSLGQNNSTMERHVTSPFTMTDPSKQTSDRGTTPQTNSPSNTNAPSVLGPGQKQNAMNPAVNAMSPEGNENIIMNGSKSIDYLNMITKESSDSDIYYRGFEDGRADKEMDKSLANLTDDYFHGWQDGQIYQHAPVEEAKSNQPQKRSLGPVDMKPGSNALPDLQGGYQVDRGRVTASVDTECNECGSIRIAHCGAEECNDNNGVNAQSVVPPTDNLLSETLNTNENTFPIVASVNCKNCYGSGIVCRDCGCAR